MGVSNANNDDPDFGGVHWNKGVETRQGDMLESRFDCLKETYSAFGERSMLTGGQRKVGVIYREMYGGSTQR